MPLLSQNTIISCLNEIQTGFTFLVPACPGCPEKEDVKRVVPSTSNYAEINYGLHQIQTGSISHLTQ